LPHEVPWCEVKAALDVINRDCHKGRKDE